MAIGLKPRYIEDFPLEDLTPEQFLVITTHTAQRIGWNISYISTNGLIAHTNYGLFNWNAEVRIKIEGNVAILKSTSTGSDIIDWGRNKKNLGIFTSNFNAIKPAFTAEDLIVHAESLQPFLVQPEVDIFEIPQIKKDEPTLNLFSIFKPVKGYFITPILLNINILLFILMVMSGVNIMDPDSNSLLKWGANFRPLTLHGEEWRLISSFFLHIGVLHLLMNMYALAFIGFLLEPHLGKARFITAYMLTGIAACITSLWWHNQSISAGASGAIFGMYGVFLALLTTDFIEKKGRKALLASIAIFIGYNLIGGLKEGIDNAAHIGGLFCGLLIGYAFIPGLRRPNASFLRLITIFLVTTVVLISSFIIYTQLSGQ